MAPDPAPVLLVCGWPCNLCSIGLLPAIHAAQAASLPPPGALGQRASRPRAGLPAIPAQPRREPPKRASGPPWRAGVPAISARSDSCQPSASPSCIPAAPGAQGQRACRPRVATRDPARPATIARCPGWARIFSATHITKESFGGSFPCRKPPERPSASLS
jgi:hypothetical protein